MDWSVLIEPRNCDISAEREINEPQALYLVNNDKVIDLFLILRTFITIRMIKIANIE